MSEPDKNIHRKEFNPYGPLLISPMDRDKHQKEAPPEFPGGTSLQLSAMLLSFLQRLIDLVDSKASSYATLSLLEKTLEDVKTFRKLLALLAGEDCSHIPFFNQQLSELWHNLLDDCNCLPLKEPSSSAILGKIKFFIQQIQNFPIESEYTLGYYFSQELGKEWVPFPCMRLLQDLHTEFAQDPSHSTLHNWILLLDDILLSAAKL
jgi:hypothetical protein